MTTIDSDIRPSSASISGMQRVGATLTLVVQGARAVLSYRADVFVGTVGAGLRVVLVFAVWTAVFGAQTSVNGVDHRVAVGYAVLGALFSLVLQPWQYSNLLNRIADGTVVFDLLRPLSLITVSLAQEVGSVVAQLPKGIIGLTLALLVGAVPAPGHWDTAIAFALSSVFGAANALLCNLLVDLTGFWTLDVGGAMIIYRMAAMFCSGALIPLWFMPSGLVTVLRVLPFSAQIFDPLSIYFDARPGWHTLGTLAVQLLWVVVLFGLVQLVWQRAYRRVVINGG